MTPKLKVVELGHVVEDLDQAMQYWTQAMCAGPFYVLDVPAAPGQIYRGSPTSVSVRVAFGFTGDMAIELIQQTNDTPSVFTEILEKRGSGAHHMKLCEPYDEGVARLSAQGYDIAFSGVLEGGKRFCLLDATSACGGFIELMDASPEMEAMLARMHEAHLAWDGETDPVRDMTDLF